MAFVYEPFTEAEKQRVNFPEITKKNFRVPEMQNQWAVDRERNAFLVWGGSDREPPYYKKYFISVDGTLFNPYVKEDGDRMPNGYFNLTYKVVGWGACLPKTEPTEQALNHVKALFREALEVFQKGLHGSDATQVRVEL